MDTLLTDEVVGMTDREKIPTTVVEDSESLARTVAGRIASLIRSRRAAGETAVLGLATGSTPIGVYRELIRRHREEDLDLGHVVTFNLDVRGLSAARERIEGFLEGKEPGDVDIPEVEGLKRTIRESEAISALETLGLGREQARFLDMPFYRTGRVRKEPIGDEDVEVVRAVLEETRPEMVFAAGDLSDPHGTHRKCLRAVERALARHDGPAPEVWLYRGAWQEWPVSRASVLVPMSEEELELKIRAIFKHESQKDRAPFPGPDEREFWERVRDRNRGTADELDRLGLPAYFAIEAYLVRRDGEEVANPIVATSSLTDGEA